MSRSESLGLLRQVKRAGEAKVWTRKAVLFLLLFPTGIYVLIERLYRYEILGRAFHFESKPI